MGGLKVNDWLLL